jgi:hypothetical protein
MFIVDKDGNPVPEDYLIESGQEKGEWTRIILVLIPQYVASVGSG